jgi:hypothetical protein
MYFKRTIERMELGMELGESWSWENGGVGRMAALGEWWNWDNGIGIMVELDMVELGQ